MTLLCIYYHCEGDERIPLGSLDFHPEMLKTLHEMGIIEINEDWINHRQLQRIYKALRLRDNLGVNMPGAAIILDLLDRIEEMQEEIERLKKAR